MTQTPTTSTLRTTIVMLAGFALAAVLAWRFGGTEGTGILGGYLLGGTLATLGLAWQNHVLRVRPERVLVATVSVFLLKLAVLLAAAVAFRYVEAAAARVDWRAFLVAYAAGIVLALSVGSFDTLRILKQRRSVA